MFPLTETDPPLIAGDLITTGGQPPADCAVTFAPMPLSASTKGPMGRSRIRWTPSKRNWPPANANAAVKNLTVVPLLPIKRSSTGELKSPALPETVSFEFSKSASTATPSFCRLSIITRVSSLSSAPVKIDLPPASAAQIKARLVMLLEPGGRIEPFTSPETGWIVTLSGGVAAGSWEFASCVTVFWGALRLMFGE